jgi:hypothetical protein
MGGKGKYLSPLFLGNNNDDLLKVVTPVKTGVQGTYSWWKELVSGACPGPDPGFAGMTGNLTFLLFTSLHPFG